MMGESRLSAIVWRRRWCRLPLGVGCAITIYIAGCSFPNGGGSNIEDASDKMLLETGDPSECTAVCIASTVAIAREALGLDPEAPTTGGRPLDPQAIFGSLETQAKEIGSTITRVAAHDAIEMLSDGPTSPFVLVHKSGHLYSILGAIRVNEKMLCQVMHGNQSVSLVSKRALMEAQFQEAWRFARQAGAGVPIHVGSAVVEFDKLQHNFGEVLPGRQVECTFRLRNVGNMAVSIGKPNVSCQCTVPNLTRARELLPSESLDLVVTTKPTGSSSLRSSVFLNFGDKQGSDLRRVQLLLLGNQRTSMDVTPTRLDFGLMVPGKPTSRTVSLQEKPTDRFRLKDVYSGALPLTHSVETATDRDGLATVCIRLTLKSDDESPGEHEGRVTLSTDSALRPTIIIPVKYRIALPAR